MSTRPSDAADDGSRARAPPSQGVTARSGRRGNGAEGWFFAGFSLAVGVFLATAVTSYRAFEEFSASAAAVDLSHRIIADLDSLLTAVGDLEARQRAYLLSEDIGFLQSYSDRMFHVEALMRQLESRVSGSSRQVATLPALRHLIEAKEAALLDLALRQSGEKIDPEVLRVSAAALDEIRLVAGQIRAREEGVLAQRAAIVEATTVRNRQLILYGNAAGLVLLLLAGRIFAHNVAERRRIEAERERFFTLSLDLLCIADTSGYFKRLNPAFSETLGWTREELLSRPLIERVHADDREVTLAQLARLADGDRVDFENRYQCKDGSWRWLRWKARPFPAENLIYAIARDVTGQKQRDAELAEASEAAEAANQAKSTFLATMSHEIRTPLIGVLGMLEVLARSRLDGEQRRQLNIVHQSAQTLLQIIGDILDFSKIEAGKLEIEPVTVSLRRLLSRVVGNFSAAAESKGLRLVMDYDDAVAAAYVVDPTRLAQILGNWISNAIKFTERGGVTVRLRLEQSDAAGDTLVMSVADTGIGIPQDKLDKLFQPFVQADVSTTRRFGGTGLGLAITRKLADLIGGTVAVESAPQSGTTISLRITLPRGRPEDIQGDPTERLAVTPVWTRPLPSLEEAQRKGSLVLLAEDHPVNRHVLTLQLNLAGFQVECAEDGPLALEKFKSGRYSLVLSDLHMPGLDGHQLTAAIRAHERATGARRTPIIALTANVRSGEVERCLAADMDDYLAKPVTIDQLTQTLERWLGTGSRP